MSGLPAPTLLGLAAGCSSSGLLLAGAGREKHWCRMKHAAADLGRGLHTGVCTGDCLALVAAADAGLLRALSALAGRLCRALGSLQPPEEAMKDGRARRYTPADDGRADGSQCTGLSTWR
mmetsp:Transcript_38376/g.90233  ORF Transcript_38376/g.90233 Transcript_38376/m.90233 type:complete len:120 (-) Transcript_38376:79-438(-)